MVCVFLNFILNVSKERNLYFRVDNKTVLARPRGFSTGGYENGEIKEKNDSGITDNAYVVYRKQLWSGYRLPRRHAYRLFLFNTEDLSQLRPGFICVQNRILGHLCIKYKSHLCR